MNQAGDFLRDRFVERVILLALLAFLVFACLQIVEPFIGPMLWGIIIAVATWHPYRWLVRPSGWPPQAGRGDRVAGAAADPGRADRACWSNSLAEGVGAVAGLLRDLTTVRLPEPPTWLRDLPVIGVTLDDQWREAMVDLPASLQQPAALYRHGRRLWPVLRRRAGLRHASSSWSRS